MTAGEDVEAEFSFRKDSILRQIESIKRSRPEDWKSQVKKLVTKLNRLETELDLAASIRFAGGETIGRNGRDTRVTHPEFDNHSEDSEP